MFIVHSVQLLSGHMTSTQQMKADHILGSKAAVFMGQHTTYRGSYKGALRSGVTSSFNTAPLLLSSNEFFRLKVSFTKQTAKSSILNNNVVYI